MDFKYDIVLSFADEDRVYVDKVANLLRDAEIDVFYDKFEEVDLWGKDLAIHFDYVYRRESKYFIPFISTNYKEKIWTNYEVKTALSRAIENKDEEYILPVKFDDTELDGLRPTIAYLDARKNTPEDLAEKILRKLGQEVNIPTPQIEEPNKRIYLSTYLEISEFGGLTGINIGVTVTNFVNEDRYFGPPFFQISQPLEGSLDTFQLMNPKSYLEFPLKLEYGQQYSLQYGLPPGFFDRMSQFRNQNVKLTAFVSTTVGEKFQSNEMLIDDIFRFKKD